MFKLREIEQDFEGGNIMKLAIKGIVALFILGIIVSTISWGLGWFGSAGKVIQQEFNPEAMLKKYEWFKDASAELDKKKADIVVYKQRIKIMRVDYEGTKRKEWDRTDKEAFNQWQVEVAGVIASFNGLAAEYNAQMAKFNWAFANAGQLPQGAIDTLPREFKPYTTN